MFTLFTETRHHELLRHFKASRTTLRNQKKKKKLVKETFGNYNLSLSAERHATHSVRSKYFAVDNRTSTIITNNGEKLN